jgi:hypothetical protein
MFKYIPSACFLATSLFLWSSTTTAMKTMASSSEGCTKRFWADADYLYWKLKDSPKIIPLVVEGPIVSDGTPVLGQPGTEIILGNKKIKNSWRSGGRFALGYWFDEKQQIGIEGNYFFLPRRTKKQSVSSNGSLGSAFLTIPYFDVNTNQESSFGIAHPGQYSGKAVLKNSNTMQGAELNFLTTIITSCSLHFGVLAGFSYWNFVEHLSFNTSSPFVPPRPSDVFKSREKFSVRNNFYGGQIGAMFDYVYRKFFLNLKTKIALGGLCETANIHGTFYTNDFDGFHAVQSFQGTYFALPSNTGSHKQTRFSVIPQGLINVGCQVIDSFRLQFGYTFLYATNVLWASKQLNRNINPTQSSLIEETPNPTLIGKPLPTGSPRTDNLWIQGINLGFELRF